MLPMSIRLRLALSFFLLTVLTVFPLAGFVFWFFYQENLDTLRASLADQAQIAAMLVRDLADEQHRTASDLDAAIKALGDKVKIRFTVVDPRGAVLADSDANPALMENHSGRPEIAGALKGRVSSAERHSSTINERFLYVAVPLRPDQPASGAVRAAVSLRQMEASFAKVRNAILAGFLVICAAALLLGMRLAQKFTKPLEEITKTTRDIAAGKLKERVYVRTGDEIEVLAHSINNLASRLDERVQEISAEKSLLELILQNMANPVVLLDRYGHVIRVNRKAAEIFAITPAMIGRHNIQVLNSSLFDRAVRETIASGASRAFDIKINIGRVRRTLQAFLAVFAGPDGYTRVLAVFNDITALVEMKERQDEFVANASHELSTPLTAIKGFAETLLDGALADPELGKKFVGIIHEEAQRMHRLVNDLLRLAKLEAKEFRTEINIESVPVLSLLEAVVNELSPEWRAKKLRVIVSGEGNAAALANPDWLKQVVVNLVDNSIKYTPSGGRIAISCRAAEGGRIAIAVADTGIGIPPVDIPRIFDRFYRADRARSRPAGGTGLGLAIAKLIVEAMNGTIDVQSDPGKETVFTVFIPAVPSS